jgi:phosphotransferase system enzyme I (PtsI)
LLVYPAELARASAARRIAEAERRRGEESRHLSLPGKTRVGIRVQVMINVDDPVLLDELDPTHSDGIGLARSEFLFRADRPLPDEETQLAVYRRLLGWAAGRPVTVRTLDAGGDKPIPGLTLEGERNAFLGVRGLRLSLARPEVFAVQLRALARAAALGPLKVMVPMVTRPDELIEARRLFEAAVAEVRSRGQPAAMPPFGMMVEVPAAALTAEDFPADFYSIGSNDLVQYVVAAGRDDPRVAGLYDPNNRAVLELIARVVEAGRERGVEVSLCGDMASEPALVPHLLQRGLVALSVAPGRLAAVKAAIARWHPAPEARRG